MTPANPIVAVRYAVKAAVDAWVLPEGPVPEATFHDAALERLALLLKPWVERTGRSAHVARNLAVRWFEHAPRTGIDPDVCLLEPPPPGVDRLSSLCTWKPGHVVPRLCFEVVSENHPYKDYVDLQDRYASMGTRELVVFDPTLAGPRALGGPVPLQIWRRSSEGALERVHFGDGPAFSMELDAWLHPRDLVLDIADDREGRERWLTEAELERAEKERERAEKERERAQKELERAEKERERAEKERERAQKELERAARLELERRVAELERNRG